MKAKSVAKDFPIVCVGGSAGGLDRFTIPVLAMLNSVGSI